MKHGYPSGDYGRTVLTPDPGFNIRQCRHITLKETSQKGATYRFDGYKESIVEFLATPHIAVKEIRFEKNPAITDGVAFEDSNLFVVLTNLIDYPTTPGGAVVEAVRQAAGGLAGGAITGTIAALGQAGRTVVQLYDVGSGVNSILHVDKKLTSLAGKQMYKNQVTRQIHHKFQNKISVSLEARVSPSRAKAHKIIDTAGTSITCGALAVLVEERF